MTARLAGIYLDLKADMRVSIEMTREGSTQYYVSGVVTKSKREGDYIVVDVLCDNGDELSVKEYVPIPRRNTIRRSS